MITPRSVAVEGIGFGPLPVAMAGFFAEEEIAEIIDSVAVTLLVDSPWATSLTYASPGATGLSPMQPPAAAIGLSSVGASGAVLTPQAGFAGTLLTGVPGFETVLERNVDGNTGLTVEQGGAIVTLTPDEP